MSKENYKKAYDKLYKILIIGDEMVGKSKIISRFINDTYIDLYMSTIGVDFKSKIIVCDNNNIKLQIWDSSGNDKFDSITKLYYRGMNGIIIVFDVKSKISFNNVTKWLDKINNINVTKLLIGNNIDSERYITYDVAKEFADSHDIEYIETSAKNNINIQKIFQTISEKLINKDTDIEKQNINILLNNRHKYSCC
jgi:Ras-related protein Rab-1A